MRTFGQSIDTVRGAAEAVEDGFYVLDHRKRLTPQINPRTGDIATKDESSMQDMSAVANGIIDDGSSMSVFWSDSQ